MIKTYCDAYGQEKDCREYKLPCHIAEEEGEGCCYVDREGNQTSGRLVHFDLCQSCRNLVDAVALIEINRIKADASDYNAGV